MARIINTAELTRQSRQTANDAYWTYNGLDCCVTYEILEALLLNIDNVNSHTYDVSRSLQAPIMEMSMRGILVNQNKKMQAIDIFQRKVDQLNGQLSRIVEEGVGYTNFNWRSPKQLGELLYDVMGLPPVRKRNANGQMVPTTNRDALEKLSNYFIAEPIIAHLLQLRDIQKKIDFLRTGIDADGRMRSSLNIAGTNTGRLASSMSEFGTGTNMQNIDRTLKGVFTVEPGWKLANLDLEQADSRNLGALMWNIFVEKYGETFAGKYLDACESGDLHTAVCRMALTDLPWGSAPDREIADRLFYRDKTYRDGSKVLGHGSNYLGTPVTMAKHTKFPAAMVRSFQEKYFGAFPVIPEYHKWVQSQLLDTAQLTTLFGRRRFFFGRPKDAATLREAVAYSPQSMTADEINIGMLNLWRANKIKLLMQVHDSLLFAFREEEENEIIPWALEALRAPLILARGREFVVPTEAKTGWNWGDYNDDPKKGAINLDGQKKWKGGDSRQRTELDFKLSIRGM